MCLIVFKRNDRSVFTNRQFKNMIARNNDGLGIMYIEDGRVKHFKTVGSDKEKFKLFQQCRNKVTYAMHSRYKTHGLINEKNCHPYELLSIDKGDPIDLYVMHNGVLDAPDIDKDMSDTWHYMEYILKPIIKADIDLLWESPHIQRMITKAIGGSKLLFMRSDPVKFPILILNSTLGTEKDGCWLSNSHGCTETGYTYGRQGGHWDAVKKVWSYDARPLVSQEERETAFDAMYDVKKYTEKDFTKQGALLLPKEKKDDKIITLKPQALVEHPNENLMYVLRELRSLSDLAIKDFIRDDPDLTADIIMELYPKNTMDYETIMKVIKTPVGLDNITNLIRHMAIDEDKRSSKRL